MRNSPLTLFVYRCTFDQAIDIACRRSLHCCEPDPQTVNGLSFTEDSDLVLFKLAFYETVEFKDRLAIVLPEQQNSVEVFIRSAGMNSRIQRHDLLGIWFWNAEDRTAFEEELG